MDRLDVALALLVVLGLALIVTAPPDPQYELTLTEVEEPDPDSVRAYEDLGDRAQSLVAGEVEGDTDVLADYPPIHDQNVSYEGTVYHVTIRGQDGPIHAVVMPLVGMWLAALAGVGLAGRQIWRLVKKYL